MSSIQRTDALLLGRHTCDNFVAYWPFPSTDDPVTATFASIPRFVVARTLGEPRWAGTTVLRESAAVASPRDEFEEVHTWRSGELLRSLLAEGLLDRLALWMYRIALGTGKRLFDTGTVPMAFRPVRPVEVSESGIMALVLEPAGDV